MGIKTTILNTFYRKFTTGFLLIAAILCAGTMGYHWLGGPQYSLLDCFYMTFITISTIGYGEIINMSSNPSARVFTMFLALTGIGVLTYLLSNFTAFIVGGELKEAFKMKNMENKINKISNHYIVCGVEGDGYYIVHELFNTARQSVVIETDMKKIERVLEFCPEQLYIEGDATDNDILLNAGIQRAKGIFASGGDDHHNLVVGLTAKQLNPGIKVVARCKEIKNKEKIKIAGADVVVSPHFIGGLRMASEMVRPAVVSFLDTMLRDKERNLRIEEVVVPQHFKPKDLGSLNLGKFPCSLLLAVKEDKNWTYNPPGDHFINPGSVLIFMTSPEERTDIIKYIQKEI